MQGARAALKEEPEATRARLLETACQIFAESGYRGATVREICARAGVNVASVNYHFRDKLGLYTEVLHRCADAAAQLRIRTAMSMSRSPEDALRAFVRGMFDKMCRDDKPAWHIKIMMQEMANATPALATVVNQVVRPQYEQLCQLIGGLIGNPPDARATRLCVHSLLGQITHYAHARALIRELWPELQLTAEERNEIADHVVRFTLLGLNSAAPILASRRTSSKKQST